MQYRNVTKYFHEIRYQGVVQVGAQLRNVGAVKGAGVQVDEHIAVLHHVVKEGIGDPGCDTAVGITGKVAIQVPSIR